MSINFPSNVIISNVQIQHDIPVFYNESINRKGTSYDRDIHQLRGSFDVTIQTENDQRAFESFLLVARGRMNPFYLNLGKRFSTNIPNATLNGSHPIGSNQLSFGLGAGNVPNGSFINMPNDDKVYMMIEDLQHASPVSIYPSLRKQQPDNAVVTFKDIKVLARLESDLQIIDYEESGLIHTTTLNWVEAL